LRTSSNKSLGRQSSG
jgi:hypothetical protein